MGGPLLFKHAQPNMCHSPKVDDRVYNKLFISNTHFSEDF